MNRPVFGPMGNIFPHQAVRLAPVLSLIGLCLAGAPPTPGLAGPPVDRATAAGQIVYEAGRLTVDLKQASLRQVLTTVARQAGFRLTIRGDRDPLVSTSFTGFSVNDGLRRLLGRHNRVGLYKPPEDRGRAGAITELLVILGTGGNQVHRARPLPRAVAHPAGKVAAGPSARVNGRPGSATRAGAFAKEAARIAASLSAESYGAAAPDDLGRVLLDESDPELRLAAVRALHELRALEARRTFETGLTEPVARVRETWPEALDAWR